MRKATSSRRVGLYILGVALALALSVVLGLWYSAAHENSYTVSGRSMEPVFSDGDHIEVTHRDDARVARGDIAVFLEPDSWKADQLKPHVLVKKVIGTPGDTVNVTNDTAANAGVYVNGEKLTSFPNGYTCSANEVTLGDDEYLVMGLNMNHSSDSVRRLCAGNAAGAVVTKDRIQAYGEAVVK